VRACRIAEQPGRLHHRRVGRAAAAGQRDDGGWMFNWPSWPPAAERDWRGYLTVDALRILRANGRL
jgi:hypothetical protein